MGTFAFAVIGILTLLLVASGGFLVSRRIGFPFTILLFIIGLGLYGLTTLVPELAAIFQIKLSPEIVFYIFLPTLLFESAYKMSYRRLTDDAGPIAVLAVIGLLISAIAIAGGTYAVFTYGFGMTVPFIVLLLFGALISATDPVAVLALFKEFGVPKRLEMLFDGESVFNDGTALALFLIVFEVAKSGVFTAGDIGVGLLTFASMLVLGIAYGGLAGVGFSRLIGYVKNSPEVEITLMMALAHLTFISADLISEFIAEHGGVLSWLRVSPVIATAIAALTLGNYGKYKISPPVEKAMDMYWGYFAFICNSLIFLMMGYVIGTLDVAWGPMAGLIATTIVIVALARAVSIYLSVAPLNFVLKHKIPLLWQHLLAYGSLRGGLAVAMVLLLPVDFAVPGWTLTITPTQFLTALTLGCIIFTLLIKATTFGPLMRALGVGDYSPEERFTDCEVRGFTSSRVLKELAELHDKKFLLPDNYAVLAERYRHDVADYRTELAHITETTAFRSHVVDIVARYALGIERYAIEELFAAGEVNERIVRILVNKIEGQYARLERGEPQILPPEAVRPLTRRVIEWLDRTFLLANPHERVRTDYLYALAREKICLVVQKDLTELYHDLGDDSHLKRAFSEVQLRYTEWHAAATLRREELTHRYPDLVRRVDHELADTIASTTANHTLETLHRHEIISEKIHNEIKKMWELAM